VVPRAGADTALAAFRAEGIGATVVGEIVEASVDGERYVEGSLGRSAASPN
jgi:hypothetical protein